MHAQLCGQTRVKCAHKSYDMTQKSPNICTNVWTKTRPMGSISVIGVHISAQTSRRSAREWYNKCTAWITWEGIETHTLRTSLHRAGSGDARMPKVLHRACVDDVIMQKVLPMTRAREWTYAEVSALDVVG